MTYLGMVNTLRPISPKQTKQSNPLASEQGCNALSDEEITLALKRILPSGSKVGQAPDLSDTSFDEIANLLRQAGRKGCSQRPRMYAVLKVADLVELVDDFVQAGFWDIALPSAYNTLPKCLLPSQSHQILAKQDIVLTKATRIEGGFGSTDASFGNPVGNIFYVLKANFK
jgi:hypothetical protein